MRLLKALIPSSCEIALLGDTHEGARGMAGDLLMDTLRWTKVAKDRFWVHMGDAIEAITCDDKRFVPSDRHSPSIPLQEALAARHRYAPYASRCLAFLSGNHDGMLVRFGELARDVICAADKHGPDMPFGGRLAKLALRDKHGPIAKLFLWHPSRVTITSNAKDYQQALANRKARLKMLMEKTAADCAIMAMGHVHQLLVVEPAHRLELYDNGTTLKQMYLGPGEFTGQYIERDRRWYVATGSYLRSQMLGEDSYAELIGYPPTELGHVRVTIRDRQITAVEAVVQ